MPLTHRTELTRRIIALAMRVHTHLGPGLLESAYEKALCHEFTRINLKYRRQVQLPVEYGGAKISPAYRIDFVVEEVADELVDAFLVDAPPEVVVTLLVVVVVVGLELEAVDVVGTAGSGTVAYGTVAWDVGAAARVGRPVGLDAPLR